MATNTFLSRLGGVTQLSDLFKKSAEAISRNINVATLGTITAISTEYGNGDNGIKYGVAEVTPFPLPESNGATFDAYFFSDDFESGDLVLVIFMDYDFRDIIKTPGNTNKQTKNKNTHAKTFGVLIKIKGD